MIQQKTFTSSKRQMRLNLQKNMHRRRAFFSDEAKINLHDSDDRKFVKVKEKKKRERISTRQQDDLHYIGMFGIFLTVMMVNLVKW